MGAALVLIIHASSSYISSYIHMGFQTVAERSGWGPCRASGCVTMCRSRTGRGSPSRKRRLWGPCRPQTRIAGEQQGR